MKLLGYQICFLLFLKSCGFTDNGANILHVYVQKGDDAKFQFDALKSILSARFGENRHDFDAKPLYMRVPDNNASDEPKSDRVEFGGDLKTGKLCFILENVDADDNNKIFRINYKTNDTNAPKTIDFILRIQEAPPSPSESSSNHSTSTQAPSSTNSTSTDVNRTTEIPTTQPPSNSTVDPPEATDNGNWWKAVVAVVVVVVLLGLIFFIYCAYRIKKRSIRNQALQNKLVCLGGEAESLVEDVELNVDVLNDKNKVPPSLDAAYISSEDETSVTDYVTR